MNWSASQIVTLHGFTINIVCIAIWCVELFLFTAIYSDYSTTIQWSSILMYTIFTYTASYVVTESLMIEVVILMKCPCFKFLFEWNISNYLYMYTVIFSVFKKKKIFLKCDLLKSLFIKIFYYYDYYYYFVLKLMCFIYISTVYISFLYHFDEFCK